MLLKHSFFCEKVNQSLTYSFARSVINIYTHCKLWQTQTHSAELGLSGVPCCWVCFFWAFFEGGGCWVTTIPSCYCCLERLLHALHLLSCQVRSVLHIDPLWYGKTWKKNWRGCLWHGIYLESLTESEGEKKERRRCPICHARSVTGRLLHSGICLSFNCNLGKWLAVSLKKKKLLHKNWRVSKVANAAFGATKVNNLKGGRTCV